MISHYSRKLLVDVLTYHQPTKTSSCVCGWNILGASHPEHVADVYEFTQQEGVRVPIERIEEDGRITPGTALMRGVTLDDYRSMSGAPLKLPPGAKWVVVMRLEE